MSLAASYMTPGAIKKRGRPASAGGSGPTPHYKKRAAPPKVLLEIRYDGKEGPLSKKGTIINYLFIYIKGKT